MILEVAIMKIKPDLIENFETVFPQAAAISASTPGYISHELQRCVETKGKYFYLIRWESIEAPGELPAIAEARRVSQAARRVLGGAQLDRAFRSRH